MSITVPVSGLKVLTAGAGARSTKSNRIEPTNADLGFVEGSFTALTDQEAGTHLFTAQVLNPSVFTLQGYSFSNFRRTSGFSKLTGGTEGATSRPFTSASMVLGDADAVAVTISVDYTGPTSGTISATIPGLIEAPPGSGIVVHEFTLHNTGASPIEPRFRLGLAFEKGAFPDSFKIKVRDQASQTDVDFAALASWNSWSDDSYRSTADGGLVGHDSNALAAGASRLYQAYITNGGQGTGGFNPWTWLAASSDDLTVDITSRTGSSSGTLSDLAFSLKTAIATTTRREILCDTDRFVRIKAWQKVAGEEHLICEFHVDFWLDGNGDPEALEVAPVLTQHWWVNNPFGVTQTKERYTYDAVVKYGTTVLDSRSSLAHAYYCRWASLRPQNDAQHARKHWIDLGAAMPTVRVQYSDASLKAMMKAGYIPPYRLGVSYSSDMYALTSTYTPLGTNGHRAGINGTGAYVGRGMWGDPDAKLVCRQAGAAATAELAWRRARVMAQAGLSGYFHVRDHRSANGVNGGTGTTNRLIPQPFRKAATLGLSQSYAGLAGPAVYSKGSNANTSGLTVLAHSAPTGGTGSFNSYDTAHAVNYSAPMAFLEGEAYLADTARSHMNTTHYAVNFNQLSHDTGVMYYSNATRASAQGIPTSSSAVYGTALDASQERSIAWGLNLLTHAWLVTPDAGPEWLFIQNLIKNTDKWLSDSFGYYPTAHRTHGVAVPFTSPRGTTSPWMCNWQGMAAYQMARAVDFLPDNARDMTGIEEMAHLAARYVVRIFSSDRPYACGEYHSLIGLDAGLLTFVGQDEFPSERTASISGDVFTVTPPVGMSWQNGDKLRVPYANANLGAQSIPTGLTVYQLYHVVNVSGNTFQLSTTEGGGAVTGIANTASLTVMITPQAYSQSPIGPQGTYYWPLDDHYMCMAYALFEEAVGMGHEDMDNTKRDAGRAFMAPKVAAFSDFAPWNYDGSSLQ